MRTKKNNLMAYVILIVRGNHHDLSFVLAVFRHIQGQ